MLSAAERDVSMVFQSYALFPHMTVLENVCYGLRAGGTGRARAREQAAAKLALVGLAGYEHRLPSELSGGQQQRVALARAIVIEPEVLLLDEPLSNLDANLREEMRSEIRRLHDAFRITTVYVTHDQAEAMVISDRIVVMSHGRIEQVDDPVSMYNRPKTRFVAGFIGRTNFLDGTLSGNMIAFDGFALRADLAPEAASLTTQASFSIRPQTIAIHRSAPSDPRAGWWIEGRIIERAYLGENWDYVVRPEGSLLHLRASAPPMDMHETGANVWLQIDPARAAHIPPP
jgi:iron(III) transport system ATP-binding protein